MTINATVALNDEKTGKNKQIISKIKAFINRFDCM